MDDDEIVELVDGAMKGDQAAWNELVRRFMPVVTAVARRHRLSQADTADVNQTVWLRVVEHLAELREARALPKWIAVVTRNECLRVLTAGNRVSPLDLEDGAEPLPRIPDPDVDEPVLRAERVHVLRTAFATLSARCRDLLSLLMTDPPVSYTDISTRLGMPIGSIGPTRIRCLGNLRRSPIIEAFLEGGEGDAAAVG